MRSNSGKDKSATISTIPPCATGNRAEVIRRRRRRSPRRRPTAPDRTQGLAHPVVSRHAVQREGQHKLAGTSRPAERGFGVAHPFAGTNNPPEDIGETRPRRRNRGIEAPLGVDLRSCQIRIWFPAPPRL